MRADTPCFPSWGRSLRDRRTDGDRRDGCDRRGFQERQPPSPISRPYGFREFTDRRRAQDRRVYGVSDIGWENMRSRWPAPVWSEGGGLYDEGLIDVTPLDPTPPNHRR